MENENEPTNDGGALRKQLEDALKKNKEMSDRLAAMEARERTQSVEKALSEKGLNPKLAKFVSSEDGSDPARLDAWIKENADLFGMGENTAPEAQSSGQPSVDPATAEAFKRIQNVSQNGAHTVSDMSALQAQIKNANSPAELNNLMANILGQLGG